MHAFKFAARLAALAALSLSALSGAQAWWKPGVATTWQWQLKGTVNTI